MIKITKDTRLVILTGAGISAESGLRTFRDSGGLWEDQRVEDVATPEGFARDPKLVWRFYKIRYREAIDAQPNAGHTALVKLERFLDKNFCLITQNVDGLHTKAGSTGVLEMHGSLFECYCTKCRTIYRTAEIDLDPDLPICSKCGSMLRPYIVWFGEIPYHLPEIEGKLRNCDVLMIIGTSGNVYPAAGFVMTAKYFGASTMAVNLDPVANSDYIDEFHQGKAGEILPKLVEQWC